MGWTPEQKREARAVERMKKNIFPVFFEKMKERDALAGKERFKSEVYDQETLAKIFTGVEWKETQEEDDRRTSSKNKKKRKVINPSDSSIMDQPVPDYAVLEDLVSAFDNWLNLRDRARKDLFWLCKLLKTDVEPDVHQVVCDQFVKKNFDGAFPKGYTIKQVHEAINRQERFDHLGFPTKEMMLLDSRGFFKSTIDGIDAIQWMLNCPDIRIFLITGEYKLGIGFLKQIKGYLYLADGGDPSDLQLLFPEYIVKGVDGTSKEPLTLEIRKHVQKDPTIWVNSIDSNLSGWHCDIKKGDDVVTDANSNSEDVRIALKEKYDGTNNIVGDHGFIDHIGTRYFPNDWYGTRIASYTENQKENTLKYFCRGCWVVKPEFSEVPLKELTPDMVVLSFPQLRTFKSLRQKLLNNEREFRCQQLNEPAGLDKDEAPLLSFSEDAIRLHIIAPTAAPKNGETFICWDWALTANRYSDYSVGVAARIYPEGEKWVICILEIIYDRWVSSELALQIVLFNKKWNPRQTLIEASAGANLLWDAIRNAAIKYGVTIDAPIWKPPSLEKNAKRNRITGLQTLLADNRLFFVAGPWLDEMIKQLTSYTGKTKNQGRKDDIPDAMSYLSIFLRNGPLAKDSEEVLAVEKQQRDKLNRQKQYDRVFGSLNNPIIPTGSVDQGWKPRWPTRT